LDLFLGFICCKNLLGKNLNPRNFVLNQKLN